MHGHPDLVGIMLTNGTMRMTYPDGTTEDIITTAGQVTRMPATEHLPQNASGHVFEAILIELKP